jgi:outer membrane protein TolC
MKKWILALWLSSAAWGETLTLDHLLSRVVEHHPKLRGARLLRSIAEAKVTEKEGAFDPSLLLGTEYLRYQSPTGPGKAKFADDHLAAVQVQDIAGWKLITGYRRNRGDVKSPDNLTGEGGEFFLEFKLPLLRGLGINEKQTALAQAEVGRQIAEALATATRLEVLMVAAVAYWDWCAACTEFVLLQRNLALAEERAQQVEKRVSAGELPRIDAVEARQEVERRKESLAKSQRNIEKNLYKLAVYLWNSQGEADQLPTPAEAVLTFPGELAEPILGPAPQPRAASARWDPSQAGKTELDALSLRPELSNLRFQRDIIELDRKLAENDRMPALDLTLGPGLDTGFKNIGLTYKVGLQLTVPLATRGPDGRMLGARLKNDKLELEQVLEIQRILSEVRDAQSMVRQAEQRQVPALESLRLALELEKAERVKFSLGDSTLFLVNQRERNTMSEALKVVEIWADGLKGQVMLEASAGRL